MIASWESKVVASEVTSNVTSIMVKYYGEETNSREQVSSLAAVQAGFVNWFGGVHSTACNYSISATLLQSKPTTSATPWKCR